MSTALPLKVNDELRAITNSDLKRDSAVMMSSTIPSAKYSCSGSPDMFWNGSTAMDGLSGRAGGCAVSAAALLGSVEGEFLSICSRQARIGSAMFFNDCGP